MDFNNSIRRETLIAGCFCLFIGFSSTARAALVTVSGAHVDFTWDTADLGLFGSPTVSGDQLLFSPDPALFRAESAGGIQLTNDSVNITITGRPGGRFQSISLVESGSYLHSGAFGAGAIPVPDVGVTGEIRVQDKTINSLGEVIGPLSSSSDFSIAGTPRPWDAAAVADLTGPAWNGVTTVSLTIENILTAAAQPGNTAFIDKGSLAITVTTVPLPPAMILLFSGVAGLALIRRRKGNPQHGQRER